MIISTYFATISRSLNKPSQRFKRLIIPCLIWSSFYGLLNFVATGRVYFKGYQLASCILATPSTHLWYLPYMFLVLIALDKIKTLLSRERLGIIAGIIAIALMLLAPSWRAHTYSHPLDLYIHALPAVLSGVFLASYYQISTKLRLFILSAIILVILIMDFVLPLGIGIPYSFGFLPSLLLLRSDILAKKSSNVVTIASLMYGVYLIHFAFFLVFWSLEIKYYWLPILVFLLSVTSIWIIKKVLPKNLHQYLA